jgi:hypothetical protein
MINYHYFKGGFYPFLILEMFFWFLTEKDGYFYTLLKIIFSIVRSERKYFNDNSFII